jgi:hypothetical protein
MRDFELRFGRRALGMWLPETAVDLPTLQLMAEAGIGHTILTPWQVRAGHPDTRRPYRVELAGGHHLIVALFDGELSGSVSFDPSETVDADRFGRERLMPRFRSDPLPDGRPLVLIATDGELYGHHRPFRELFLRRLVGPRPDGSRDGFDISSLADALREPPGRPFRAIRIADRTSWSCHHGILRWSGDCPCAENATWKAPLRAALERLAAGVDSGTERLAGELPGSPDPWAARDDYVDVVVGVESPAAFAERWLGAGAAAGAAETFLALMETQRQRLAMFASDAWYWDDPVRPETKNVLRAAAWAARRMDGLAGSGLERRLVADLAMLRSPGHLFDGKEIYRRALSEVGQPVA